MTSAPPAVHPAAHPDDGSGRRVRLRNSPGIDGMRGIGISVVMAYHAGVGALEGAFLDMDMFFACSGFLITGLLLLEWDRTGGIHLPSFWLARARRLLPALFGALVLVAGYAAFLADPTTRSSLRLDMFSTLFFVANWRFINDSASYFATDAVASPLLHMWSLAIEEQFYLVWPVLLVLWLRWRRGSLRGLTTLLVALALASAVYMSTLFQPGADPSEVYFNTASRAQALLLGCALAVVVARRRRRGPSPIPGAAAGAGLIALMVMLALPFLVDTDSHWVFHGGFLLSGLLTCAFLYAVVVDPGSLVARICSWRPLVAVGLRTYGLYVWHWPIFVILDERRTGLTGIPLFALRLGLTFVVAFAYDRWVERPIRRGALRRMPSPRGSLVAIGAALGVAGLTVAGTANAQPTIFGTALPGYISTVTGPMLPGQHRVVVLGDSVAFTLWKHFPEQEMPDLSVGSSTQLGCGIHLPQHLVVEDHVTGEATQCAGYEQRWSKLIDAADPDAVVLVSGSAELFDVQIDRRTVRSGTPEWDARMAAAYGHALDVAGQGGRRQVLLANIPCYGRRDDLTVEQAHAMGFPAESRDAAEHVQNDPVRQERLNAILERLDAERANVHLLDLRGFLCPNGRYEERLNGVVMRSDGVHLDPQAVTLWWRRFAPLIRQTTSGAGADPGTIT